MSRPCIEVCVPYFQEIADNMLTEDPQPEIQWLRTPDLTNPFPPQFEFLCPHQLKWTCQPTGDQIRKWEKEYPLQPEVFPEPFVCLVATEAGADGCDYLVEPAPEGDIEPLEVPLAVMLQHIRSEHGAPAWMAMHHLCANYPGLNNYCGSQTRIEAGKNPASN